MGLLGCGGCGNSHLQDGDNDDALDAGTQDAAGGGSGGDGSGGDGSGGDGSGGDGSGGDGAGGFMFPSAGAPRNDYGVPQDKFSPLPGGSGVAQCASMGGDGTTGECVVYWSCHIPCELDDECPDGGEGGGTAVPKCHEGDGDCRLDCTGGESCPDGMVCVDDDGLSCLWPEATADTGCPGHCYQDNVPDDCPNYCGMELAGCDNANDSCCDGLVCAPWRTCEVGDCLQPTWPCTDGGRACCEGSSCEDGFCSVP